MRTAAKLVQPNNAAIIQVGVTGGVDQLNAIADYVAKRFARPTLGLESKQGFEKSFLDGDQVRTRKHIRTPPSVHSYVRLWKQVPEISSGIGLLNIVDPLEGQILVDLLPHVVQDTILVGHFEVLKEYAASAGARVYPLLHCGERVALKIYTN